MTSVSHRVYLVLSGSIFFMVSLLHMLRLLYHWPIVVGPWAVPYSLSYVGFPVAFAYGIWAFWLCRS